MKVNNIKEENNKKIEKYELLLETIEHDLSELKLEENKIHVKYNMNNKETKKMKKIVNIGCTFGMIILIIPVFLISIKSGLSVSCLYGTFLAISNKALKNMNKEDNKNDHCTKLEQTIISNEIYEGEMFKNIVENSIFVRNILNAILEKKYIALTELETISNILSKNDILYDFNINEYNILNQYIKKYNIKEEIKNLNNYYHNIKTKEKIKIKN